MLTRKPGLFINLIIIKRDRAAQTPTFASMINSRWGLFPWLFVCSWGGYRVYKLVGRFIGSLLVGLGGEVELHYEKQADHDCSIIPSIWGIRLQHYSEYRISFSWPPFSVT